MDEMFAREPAPMGAGWGWLMAYGILSLVIGLAAFLWPFSATWAATLIVGAFFLAAGIVSIGAGIFGGPREARSYAILFGLVSAFIGAMLIFDPATGALSLTMLVIVWLALRGLMELGWGVRFARHRPMMIALGVVNIILALLVLLTISQSALILPGYFLGISFVLAGVVEINRARAHRKGAAAFAVT